MTWIAHNHHQYSIVLDERGKHSFSIYLDHLKIFACTRWSFGQCNNASFVCLLKAQTKWQWMSKCQQQQIMAKKSLIISDYSRIQYYKSDPPKVGHTPITNMISNTYRTVSIKPYWELMHQAKPNIHCTLR
jgi:hypothetical protein